MSAGLFAIETPAGSRQATSRGAGALAGVEDGGSLAGNLPNIGKGDIMKSGAVVRLLALCVALGWIAAACSAPVVAPESKAQITLNPAAGKKGAAIAIEGKGFQSGEVIDITLDLGGGHLVGLGTQKVEEIKADASGAFKVDSGIPVNAKPGTYKVTAEGNKGSKAQAQLLVQ